MYPYISLGDWFLLDSWRVMLTAGILVGGLVSWILLSEEIGRLRACLLVALMSLSALVGAHLTHWLLLPSPSSRTLQGILAFWTDGHSLLGGLAFCAALLLAISRIVPAVPFWPTADAFSLGVPAGLFFARIGCYMKGCCWGTPIHEGHPFHGVSVKLIRNDLLTLHPVQLYSASVALAIFCTLLAFRTVRKPPGLLTALFIILYAAARFFLEFFRGDARPLLANLTLYQGICVPLLLGGICLLFLVLREKRIEGSGPAPRTN